MNELKIGNFPNNKHGSSLQDVVVTLNKLIKNVDNISIGGGLTAEDIQVIKDFLTNVDSYLKKEDAEDLYTSKAPEVPDVLYGMKNGQWEEVTLSWKDE